MMAKSVVINVSAKGPPEAGSYFFKRSAILHEFVL
jgi:hypothetical protein